MSRAKRAGGPLTGEQRRLVRENIGLVAVHLRRHVGNLSVPRRDREWEDLFQEGCLGLIQAAVAFREERGIPFAAFALPRIHNAVSRALKSKFSTVYVPPKRSATRIDPSPKRKRGVLDRSSRRAIEIARAEARGSGESDHPRVHSLSYEHQQRLADERRHDPDGPDCETISQRLRGKYERAVRAAGDALSSKTSARGDRDKLVRVLVEERFLVPHEESRRALRQIARETQSSYARVAQCDKQLGDAIRRGLEADPEFHELRRRARSDPQGADVLIDDDLDRDLAAASADEFVRRLRTASSFDRARMLDMLLNISDELLEGLVRGPVGQLPMPKRELLFRQT